MYLDIKLCLHAGDTENEDMAHPILRARQALRSAELQAERAESFTDGDIEAGPGKLADKYIDR